MSIRRARKPSAELDAEETQISARSDVSPELHRIQELGSLAGNAAVASAFSSPETAVRSRTEAATGYDLSTATIHHDSQRAASAGVHGLTEGREVHLAPGISPGTPHGDHVLAHELGHVVQQATAEPGTHTTLEAGAESVAGQAARTSAGTGRLTELPAPTRYAVQHFDPRYHRTSVVDGLADSGFSADEIGLIYAANWERDLSQAHPALGNAILEWKAVKLAAHEGRLTDAEITAFHNACQHILDVGLADPAELVNGTAYGGYKFYEHMDNPAGTDHGKDLNAALDGMNVTPLPDHIFASREHIKEMLFTAAKLSHPAMATGATAEAARNSSVLRKRLGAGEGEVVIGALPSGAVADETAAEVRRHGGGSGAGPAVDPQSLELIGRASHALEDFWSHSNFVELAIGDLQFRLGGLTTATFGSDDKTHALAHKIRGAADEIAAEMPLVDRLANRRKTDPAPDEVHLGDESTPHHENLLEDLLNGANQAGAVALAAPGAILDGAKRGWNKGMAEWNPLAPFTGAAKGAAVGGLASVLGSQGGVFALRQLSEYLDESTQAKQEQELDPQAHGLLAKDQPGHENDAFGNLKTVKFEFAHALSVAADRLVTGKMKAVINSADAAEADARLTEIYDVLDKLVGTPSPDHPLAEVIKSYRERGATALKAYKASLPRPPKPDYGPFLTPGQ